jgi:hypothetical protein
MAEWFKAAVLKTVEGREVLREFESLSLRQEISPWKFHTWLIALGFCHAIRCYKPEAKC